MCLKAQGSPEKGRPPCQTPLSVSIEERQTASSHEKPQLLSPNQAFPNPMKPSMKESIKKNNEV